VPMAAEMPDIEIGHVVHPDRRTARLTGRQGRRRGRHRRRAGRQVMNAINDALRPLDAKTLTDMPFTPGAHPAGGLISSSPFAAKIAGPGTGLLGQIVREHGKGTHG